MHYIFVENGKLNGCGEVKQLTDGVLNFEVNQELYEDYKLNPLKYAFEDGQVVVNSEFEELLAQNERKRLDGLSLTAADVERAIYKDKGMDFEDVVEMVKDNPQIDLKALKIELKANNFYRGNLYINQIGALLGYAGEELDYLFEHGEFKDVQEDNN